jgi:hypothetical protein
LPARLDEAIWMVKSPVPEALRDERLEVHPSSFRAMRDGIGNSLRRGPFDVLRLLAPACRS